jgi:hypothetical protein
LLLLRSIAESANGPDALTPPIIRGVDCCMYRAWTDKGLGWLEALDRVPLLDTQARLRDLGLEGHLSDAIRHKLTQILGPHFVPQPKPKPKRVRKKQEKPAGLSEESWNLMLELQRKRRREQCHKRRQKQLEAGGVKRSAKKKKRLKSARMAASGDQLG